MNTYLDCIPCFFKQALETSRITGANEETQKEILDKLGAVLPSFKLTSSPPEIAEIFYGIIKEITRKQDPYKEIKKKSNKLALNIYPLLKIKIENSNDSLLTAVELAIAGNIIDYGSNAYLNISKELEKILSEEKEIIKKERKRFFAYASFKHTLKKAETILYLGDNAGEVVFDRILIEEIKRLYKDKRIIYVVKETPIINDALASDALECGIGEVAEIISSGVGTPGTVLSLCSKDFLKIYKKADMVISKGQGNFEALSNTNRPVFFLFIAKCFVIAKHMGCSLGDVILLYKKHK